jgi:hypothetical protein
LFLAACSVVFRPSLLPHIRDSNLVETSFFHHPLRQKPLLQEKEWQELSAKLLTPSSISLSVAFKSFPSLVGGRECSDSLSDGLLDMIPGRHVMFHVLKDLSWSQVFETITLGGGGCTHFHGWEFHCRCDCRSNPLMFILDTAMSIANIKRLERWNGCDDRVLNS